MKKKKNENRNEVPWSELIQTSKRGDVASFSALFQYVACRSFPLLLEHACYTGVVRPKLTGRILSWSCSKIEQYLKLKS
jgi:hypothetical protein